MQWMIGLHKYETRVSAWEKWLDTYPDSKVHGANMGPTWGQQDPGGPNVGHVNLTIRVLAWTLFITQID